METTYKTLTREQFLFHEMRTTARLMNLGKTDEEIISDIAEENLFQYPTERMIKNLASVCIRRLHAMESDELVELIADGSSSSAKQGCLYAMMQHNKLVRDFMITVIGEKYRLKDYSYSRREMNVFFTRLQEQDDAVASWSEETIAKSKSVITRVLVENEYLDSSKSDSLNTVLIDYTLKNVLLDKRDYASLRAFNCFEGD